jgi:Fe2+ or Zn2+ uptake regulation protein
VPTRTDFAPALRGVALRVTRPRLAVLAAVQAHPHADTDSIIRAVRSDLGEASHPAGSVARYELRVGDNHHHVVCRSCGTIGDVDCAVNETPCLEASDPQGFTIDEAEVTYWGLCPACQTTQEN